MAADRLVSTSAAATALGVSRSTLWRWLNDGLVTPTVHLPGKHMRWDVDQLRREVSQFPASSAPQEKYMPESASTPEHRAVVAAVVTSHLGVLAGRRNDGKPPWTFIAGEVEPDEAPVDAAIREVKEETGLLVVSGHLPIGRRIHPKTGRTMIYLACLPVEGTSVFVGDEEELGEVRWLTLPEVDDLMPGMYEPVREHLARMLPGEDS